MNNKLLILLILALISFDLNSQDVYQESYLEMKDMMNSNESYLCQATTSISLLPGFSYKPGNGNDMLLEIDRYSVFMPEEGYYGGLTQGDDGVVGSLYGNFSATGTGTAVYSIDLKLPEAISNMMPKLSLVYNNQSANGIMGWAWNLSGLSSIERVGQTIYHDGKITDVNFTDDRYVLDGQRLMLVEGNYGANNAVYKTEIDAMNKIISYTDANNSPQYFKVWKNDGTIWEYGNSSDSKIEAQTDNKIVMRWLLNKISDRNGNAVIFNYDECTEIGEAYIDNIEYVSNENAGLEAAYTVSFVYETKQSDASSSYIFGNIISNKRILKNISVTNNYTDKQLLNYNLDYYYPGLYDGVNYIHYRLKSVGLTVGNDKINSTRVIWNSENKHFPSRSKNYQLHELDRNVFNGLPFVGDFNGDGFSDVLIVPYKIQNTYPNNVVAKVYLNNGDGSFQNQPMTSITLSKNLDWIYVLDLDGDGLDDIVPYEINYEAVDDNDDLIIFSLYLMRDGNFQNKATYRYKNNIQLIPGNYRRNNVSDLIVVDAYDGSNKEKSGSYITYINGNFHRKNLQHSYLISGIDASYLAIDMTGDGLAELMVLSEDAYKVYKLNSTSDYKLSLYTQGSSMNKDIYPFPNDYNGDGKTDLLYYDSRTFWNISFSKGNSFASPMSCTNTTLLRNITLRPKDKYRYSLKELENPGIAIRTGDFDGDGVADVGVMKSIAGNYHLELGVLPFVKADNTCGFTSIERYHMPLNYSHQTIQLGRFLPQENLSILSGLPRQPMNSQKAYISSLYPHSAIYSVERIVDGMGNIRGFSYDYLMQKNTQNNQFYTCTDKTYSNNIKSKSLPIAALKTDTIYNSNGKPIVTQYSYYNAMLHEEGHGFLGFEKVIARNYVNGNLNQKHEQVNDINRMGEHCLLLPLYSKLYYGEEQLVKHNQYLYKKYQCSANDKVVMPFMLEEMDLVMSFDNPNELLKCIYKKNEYISDNSSDTYDNVINLKRSLTGMTDDVTASDVYTCDYITECYKEYNLDLDKWIVSRPRTVYECHYGNDEEMIGNVTRYEYDAANPLQVVRETKIPNINADSSDPLTLTKSYKYDIVGNVVQQDIGSPSMRYVKTLKFEYGDKYGYRYITKTIDEMGKVIVSEYDNDFGQLTMTKDHNGFVTYNETNPAGVTDKILLPDGMVKSKALRWSLGNDYAPQNASYYVWEKSSGQAETMVFYHKSGLELRSVAFDIQGKAIIVDKTYDDFGNLISETIPYYQNEDKYFITHVYDKYNRLVETMYPNGLINKFVYDGNVVVAELIGNDGERRYKKDTHNVMDWVICSEDSGGNEIHYEYYCNGLMKSAQLGKYANTKISMKYDNLGNRISLDDPNAGFMKYEYDALGNIMKIVSADNDIIEFQYDILGRKISKKEKDGSTKEETLVQWVYANEKGKDGLLSKIISSENHVIDYVYDDKLRLVNMTEEIKGVRYQTSYTYDAANRIETVTYPSGVRVAKNYSNSGYVKEVVDLDDNIVLWRTNETNANGFITSCQYGNGLTTSYEYNPLTFMLEEIKTHDNNTVIQKINYMYDDFGNMTYRGEYAGVNLYEEFEYDNMDRLIGFSINGRNSCNMHYDALGNIVGKEVNGVNVLYSAVYDRNRPNAIVKAKTDDESLNIGFMQNVVYSSFDKVKTITNGDNRLDIEYGYDDRRIFTQIDKGGVIKKKTYVGNCEIIEEMGEEKMLTFIDCPNGVSVICLTDENGGKSYNYIHKDNLGSWNLITDSDANIVQELSFDAWGNMRNPDDWTDMNVNCNPLYDRGYTGHEHYSEFGLINMNGRMYDPLMSMMLSPDNNLQFPHISQNFNRYSYCLNNPLKYNDPTGESIEAVIFGIAGGVFNILSNIPDIDSFGEAALLFGVGFLKGFLTEYTMGQSWFVQVGVGAALGGVSSGVNQMVEVGDGSFRFSGDDWNSIKTAACYGLGNSLVNSFMNTYFIKPTEESYGSKLMDMYCHKELGHAITSLMAHGVGCWFSGQAFLPTMKFKDVGFDLKMLGCIAERLLASYFYDSQFSEDAVNRRAVEIRESMLNDIRSEIPDFPEFEYLYEVKSVFVEDNNIYMIADIFQMLPGQMLDIYPIAYFDEIMIFPFSYSLFRTLFLNKP